MRAKVREGGFPESRENNREFADFSAVSALHDANSRRHSNMLRTNSLPNRNRESFLTEQGIRPSEQGIHRSQQEISSVRLRAFLLSTKFVLDTR